MLKSKFRSKRSCKNEIVKKMISCFFIIITGLISETRLVHSLEVFVAKDNKKQKHIYKKLEYLSKIGI